MLSSGRMPAGILILLLVVPLSGSQSPAPGPHVVRVFEDGGFIQVLCGDPDREGGHYVMRIGNDDGQIQAHSRQPRALTKGTWNDHQRSQNAEARPVSSKTGRRRASLGAGGGSEALAAFAVIAASTLRSSRVQSFPDR